MIKFEKDNVIMAVRDENQAAAFLNNGWTKVAEGAQEPTKEKTADDFSKYMNPPVEETADTDKTYTKTDINRLSTAELKELATKENLSDVESKSGGELKKELIEHFNL